MKITKKTILSIVVVILLILGLIYFIRRGENLRNQEFVNIKAQSLEEFIFTFKEDITNKELSVSVSRDGESLTLNYENIVNQKLKFLTSNNGLTYTNNDESIVFINIENEATVYENDYMIFKGKLVE